MIGPRPVCLDCIHYHEEGRIGEVTCDAFPNGIPAIVWEGGHEHKQAIAGDSGIRFEPREGDE